MKNEIMDEVLENKAAESAAESAARTARRDGSFARSTEMISAKEASERWGVSPRWVQQLCLRGEIAGAQRWGKTWMIPERSPYPRGNIKDRDMAMPRRTPALGMTELYSVPGSAEQAVKALAYNPEASALLAAEFEYYRGNIDGAMENALYFLEKHSGFYAVLSAGLLLGRCAMWRGDIALFNEARRHIYEAPIKSESDREIVDVTLATLDCMIYVTDNVPTWFKQGNFECLHPDTHPVAKVIYVKFLCITALAVASKQIDMAGIGEMAFMKLLPYLIEPMICQAVVDKTVIAEIYMRLMCGVMYYNSERKDMAIMHLDRAIKLALPDRLFGILVEHRRHFDYLMDERLEALCPDAAEEIKALGKVLTVGWATLSGKVRNRHIATNLSPREREVARLASFGLTNWQIAERIHVSVATVKQAISMAMYKTGVGSREELGGVL